jgi:shikimate dehydrogenase
MRQFGLIGYPLGHSFSKAYFANKFVQEGIIDCQYDAFELEHIIDLKALLIAYPNLIGLNVTIPYKEQVLPFVDVVSPAVQSIGAANVLKINNGILTAYNTDIIGFQQTFCSKLQSHHTAALVLGTGGASKAVQYVLQQLGIRFLVVSRNNEPHTNAINYTDITKSVLQQYSIIINCTPLGMHPQITTCPPLPYEYLTPQHYLYDLVYRPAQTLFLQKGQEQGCTVLNGYDMLTIQAEASWKIWNEVD